MFYYMIVIRGMQSRNAICTEPFCMNKYRIMMPPNDDGPYLNDVWIVMLSPARGRPYFMMGAVIN